MKILPYLSQTVFLIRATVLESFCSMLMLSQRSQEPAVHRDVLAGTDTRNDFLAVTGGLYDLPILREHLGICLPINVLRWIERFVPLQVSSPSTNGPSFAALSEGYECYSAKLEWLARLG